ncbi:hypothetical protein AABD41_00045 [Staphylococcus pseudoxylosus]
MINVLSLLINGISVQDYQKFIIAFIFLMDDEIHHIILQSLLYSWVIGAGKNGFISALLVIL